jgi:hypothetical protein
VDRFFKLIGKVCGNRADDLEGVWTKHVSRPQSLLDAQSGKANFALLAVVKKVDVAAHKKITLLTARVSRSCLA